MLICADANCCELQFETQHGRKFIFLFHSSRALLVRRVFSRKKEILTELS